MEEKSASLSREQRLKYWKEQIQRWEQSGLSQRRYCLVSGLKLRQFTCWKGCLRENDSQQPAFVSLQLESGQPQSQGRTAARLSIILDEPGRIDIHEGFDPPTLSRLISTLRGM